MWVRVTRSLVLYVCFVDRCLSFCTCSLSHCVVCSSSIYGFWLPLWYLQTLQLSNDWKWEVISIWLRSIGFGFVSTSFRLDLGTVPTVSYIEEEQTTQWLSEQVQKDKQRSTKHTYKTKDRVTRTPLKPGGELRCSGRVSSSCSTSGARRINLVTNLVISHEWEKDRIDEIFIYELKR
jgi:hypothetical protein